jgi:cellulose synthase/poly-beta-1,6-N-acetylglucosamine synthase-like glycosyltransferase
MHEAFFGCMQAIKETPESEKTVENGWYHVRVLIPCYKEPLEVVSATVQHALDAPLPDRVKRCVAPGCGG